MSAFTAIMDTSRLIINGRSREQTVGQETSRWLAIRRVCIVYITQDGKSRAANRTTIGSRGISRWSSCAPDRISAWVMDAHQSSYPALLLSFSFSPSVSKGRDRQLFLSSFPPTNHPPFQVDDNDNDFSEKRPSLLSLFPPEEEFVTAVYWPTSEIVSTTCASRITFLSFFNCVLVTYLSSTV